MYRFELALRPAGNPLKLADKLVVEQIFRPLVAERSDYRREYTAYRNAVQGGLPRYMLSRATAVSRSIAAWASAM
jgi:hypothetical protein